MRYRRTPEHPTTQRRAKMERSMNFITVMNDVITWIRYDPLSGNVHERVFLSPRRGRYVRYWTDRGEARQLFMSSGWAYEWISDDTTTAAQHLARSLHARVYKTKRGLDRAIQAARARKDQ